MFQDDRCWTYLGWSAEYDWLWLTVPVLLRQKELVRFNVSEKIPESSFNFFVLSGRESTPLSRWVLVLHSRVSPPSVCQRLLLFPPNRDPSLPLPPCRDVLVGPLRRFKLALVHS